MKILIQIFKNVYQSDKGYFESNSSVKNPKKCHLHEGICHKGSWEKFTFCLWILPAYNWSGKYSENPSSEYAHKSKVWWM